MLPIVFRHLLAEGWLTEAELQGLGEDKMQIIRLSAGLGGQQESPGSDPTHGRSDLAG